MGRHGTSARAGHNLVEPLGTGTLFRLSLDFWVQQRKMSNSAGKHCSFGTFQLFFTVYTLGRLALSRGGFFDRLSTLLLTGTSPNQVHAATSDLNEVFEKCQKFLDSRMPLHSRKRFHIHYSAISTELEVKTFGRFEFISDLRQQL